MPIAVRIPAKNRPCIFCVLRRSAQPYPPFAYAPSRRSFASKSYHLAYQIRFQAGERRDEPEYIHELQRFGDNFGPQRRHKKQSKISASPDFERRRGKEKAKGKEKSSLSSRLFEQRIAVLFRNALDNPVLQNLDIPKSDLKSRVDEFQNHLRSIINDGDTRNLPPWVSSLIPSLLDLRRPFPTSKELEYALLNHVIMSNMSSADIDRQREAASFTNPSSWFPQARGLHRKFHLHIGPTNSGKTYQALSRLRSSTRGFYAGPLRLLAHEVYSRLNVDDLRCELVTGDYRKLPDELEDPPPFVSCTVEMVPTSIPFDVGVIDEIQMLADPERGWAWTNAVLSCGAEEVHLCGEERALPIVKELVALCGDELEVHNYERLSPLEMMSHSLDGDMTKLEKGDCVVCFDIKTIHALRQQIEQTHNFKCAVVYGSLPPEVRARQAALFNDPSSDYNILVASDAVGMGLNLNIRRMIFQTSAKASRQGLIPLKVHEIKQVAGRAGRFSVAQLDNLPKPKVTHDNEVPSLSDPPPEPPLKDDQLKPTDPNPPARKVGLVGCLEQIDYERIKSGFKATPSPITNAIISPPDEIFVRFARLFPLGTPLSFLLRRFSELTNVSSRFKIAVYPDALKLADAIEQVRGLALEDRLVFSDSPTSVRDPADANLICEYAEIIASGKEALIIEIKSLKLDLLEDNYTPSEQYLKEVERLNKGIVLHMWLAYKYPANLLDIQLSAHVRHLCEARIQKVLTELSFDYKKIRETQRLRRERALARSQDWQPGAEDLPASEQDPDSEDQPPNDLIEAAESPIPQAPRVGAPSSRPAAHKKWKNMRNQRAVLNAFEAQMESENTLDTNGRARETKPVPASQHI